MYLTAAQLRGLASALDGLDGVPGVRGQISIRVFDENTETDRWFTATVDTEVNATLEVVEA